MSKIYISNNLREDVYVIATKNTDWLLADVGFDTISLAASLATLNAPVAINSLKTLWTAFSYIKTIGKATYFPAGVAVKIFDQLRPNAIKIPSHEFKEVTSDTILKYTSISGIFSELGASNKTLFIYTKNFQFSTTFNTNDNDSWIVMEQGVVKAKFGTLWQPEDKIYTFKYDNMENTDQVVKAISDLKTVRKDYDSLLNKIENETFSISAWIGDNVFRPDNPERKKNAIEAIKGKDGIITNIDIVIEELDKLKDLLKGDIQQIINNYESWKKDVNIQLVSLSLTVPAFQDSFTKFNTIDTVVGIGIGISIFAAPILPIALALFGIIEIITAIFAAEERKDFFEKIMNETKKSNEKIKSVRSEINSSMEKIKTFYKNILTTFYAAGFLTEAEYKKFKEIDTSKDNAYHEFTEFIIMQRTEMNKWTAAIKMIENTEEDAKADNEEFDLNTSIRFAVVNLDSITYYNKKEKKDILKAMYLLKDESKSVSEISSQTGIEAKYIIDAKAVNMLLQGKTPREIAEMLNIEEKLVEELSKKHTSIIDLISNKASAA
ncbi:hypothetical protein IRZ71_20605 [Flavobacterium sp. ANB]|uniref:hypothetical protein n=1 Tax=unclassified Flavobacterium TaxID=196869 RepID=UPI0012B71774|nr:MULTISPECIES: hypothetical protein [unclassified Flavobacterium]MBF4518763.1 hypothetical protein [Flavobacterium sp. ANB]MTD71524.1 hypothetical protein [Flavobacterium sp. LC2016-13]